MQDDPGLIKIGVHLQELAAGLLGGLAGSIVRHLKPMQYVGAMVVGGLTAMFISNFVSKKLGTDYLTAAYVIGVVGSPLCLGIIHFVRKRLSQESKGTSDD